MGQESQPKHDTDSDWSKNPGILGPAGFVVAGVFFVFGLWFFGLWVPPLARPSPGFSKLDYSFRRPQISTPNTERQPLRECEAKAISGTTLALTCGTDHF